MPTETPPSSSTSPRGLDGLIEVAGSPGERRSDARPGSGPDGPAPRRATCQRCSQLDCGPGDTWSDERAASAPDYVAGVVARIAEARAAQWGQPVASGGVSAWGVIAEREFRAPQRERGR